MATFLARVPDPRPRHGVRHGLTTTLAAAVLGLICGMRGFRAVGQWAQGLTQEQRARLGCFRSPTTGRHVAPSIGAIRRTLRDADPESLGQAAAAGLQAAFPNRRPLALVGTTRKNSAAPEKPRRRRPGVIRHGLMNLVAQADVGENGNEIPVAQRVPKDVPLQGMGPSRTCTISRTYMKPSHCWTS